MRYPLALAALKLGLVFAGAAEARDNVIIAGRSPAADVEIVAEHWAERDMTYRRASADRVWGGQKLRLIYYTGPVGSGPSGPTLAAGEKMVPLAEILSPGRVVVILNVCGTNMNVPTAALDQRGDWLVGFPANTSCDAEDFARSVLPALDADPAEWEAALGQAGLSLVQAPKNGGSVPVGRVENDSIVITTLRPQLDAGPRIVAQDVALRPRDLPLPEGGGAAAPQQPLLGEEGATGRQAEPRRAGLPDPSIIVGDIAEAAPEFPRGPLGVAFGDRAKLRRESPERYASLIAEGAFDPDPGQIAAAIQTELARMGCYSGQVDGVWGGGSSGGVNRYFTAARGEAPATTASVEVYRAILAGPELTCPAVAQPTAAQNPPRGTGQATSTRRPSAGTQPAGQRRNPPATGRGRQPAATSRPQPQTPATTPRRPRIDPSFGGSGVFR